MSRKRLTSNTVGWIPSALRIMGTWSNLTFLDFSPERNWRQQRISSRTSRDSELNLTSSFNLETKLLFVLKSITINQINRNKVFFFRNYFRKCCITIMTFSKKHFLLNNLSGCWLSIVNRKQKVERLLYFAVIIKFW